MILSALTFSFDLDIKDAFHTTELFFKPIWLTVGTVLLEHLITLSLFEFCGEVVSLLIYQHHCLLIEPFEALSVLPETVLDVSFSYIAVCSKTMLLPFVPPTLVLATISPIVDSIAILLILVMLAIVSYAICINTDTISLHFVVLPVTVVLPTVLFAVDSVTLDLIIKPLTAVVRAISPSILPNSFLLTHDVGALILRTFRPRLDALAILMILFPSTFVACTLLVRINSAPMSFVINPVSFIDIAIGMEEFPLATDLVVLPFAYVRGLISPDHFASAMP